MLRAEDVVSTLLEILDNCALSLALPQRVEKVSTLLEILVIFISRKPKEDWPCFNPS